MTCIMVKIRKTLHRVRYLNYMNNNVYTQPGITCSKLTMETLEQGVKYIQS